MVLIGGNYCKISLLSLQSWSKICSKCLRNINTGVQINTRRQIQAGFLLLEGFSLLISSIGLVITGSYIMIHLINGIFRIHQVHCYQCKIIIMHLHHANSKRLWCVPNLTDELEASPLFKGFSPRLFQLSYLLSVQVPHWFYILYLAILSPCAVFYLLAAELAG